jgi:hypothetical protein
MFVNFGNLNEKMKIFSVSITVNVDGNIQKRAIQAPRMMIEQEFISLVQQATQSNEPIKLIMSIKFPLYDEWHDKWNECENSITFTNDAYKNANKDEEIMN